MTRALRTLFFALAMTASSAAHAVIGGEASPLLERHTVMVLSKKGGICSGALLAPRIVLTAAHCVTDGSDYAVHVRNILGEPILLQPNSIIIHPDYVPDAITKRVRSIDLAILKFDGTLPAPFFPVDVSSAMPRKGEQVIIGGYGMTDETKRASSGTFSSTALNVIEPYGPSKILIWLEGKPIGTSGLKTGGCHGDSGGPVFLNGKLVAITSWTTGPGGRNCGALTQGALVAPQRAWIDTVMKQ